MAPDVQACPESSQGPPKGEAGRSESEQGMQTGKQSLSDPQGPTSQGMQACKQPPEAEKLRN